MFLQCKMQIVSQFTWATVMKYLTSGGACKPLKCLFTVRQLGSPRRRRWQSGRPERPRFLTGLPRGWRGSKFPQASFTEERLIQFLELPSPRSEHLQRRLVAALHSGSAQPVNLRRGNEYSGRSRDTVGYSLSSCLFYFLYSLTVFLWLKSHARWQRIF